jgi:hypothetical protein
MRYRFAVLMLIAVLSMMNVLAAPAPEPAHAILDIGPPPKGMTEEEHCRDVIYRLTNPRGFIWYTASDPKVSKLPSVVRLKDAPSWLTKNIKATPESGWRRLRFTFRAGTRAEQVTIINALLRGYLRQSPEDSIKRLEETLRRDEASIADVEERIASGQHPHMVDRYRKGITELRTNRIPATIAEIARLKQITVIKWAK